MPDAIATRGAGEGVTPDDGAPASPEIETLRAEMERRIAGLQTAINRANAQRDAAESQLDELKTSGLSEDEKAQRALQKAQQRAAELEAKLALVQLGSKYGDVMPVYEQLIAADNAEDQLKFLQNLVKGVPAGSEPPAAPAASSGIDRNNPPTKQGDFITLPNGQVMDDAYAERILKSVPKMASTRQ